MWRRDRLLGLGPGDGHLAGGSGSPLVAAKADGRTLDHITIAVADLGPIVAEVAGVTGFEAHLTPYPPCRGLASLVLPLASGGVVGIVGPNPATPVGARARFGDRTGARLMFWTVEVASLARFARAAERAGLSVEGVCAECVDRFGYVRGTITPDPSNLLPKVIDWRPGTERPRLIESGLDLKRVTIRAPDPAAFNRIAESVGIAERALAGAPAIELEIAGPRGALQLTARTTPVARDPSVRVH